YELLTGRTPFVGDPVSLVYQHLGEQAKAPSAFQSDLSESLDAITLHALRKSPDERYQSAAEFRSDLNAARAGEPVSEAAMASLGAVGGSPDVLSGGAVPPSGFDTQRVYGPGEPTPRRARRDAQTGVLPAYADEGYERTDEIPVREQRHSGGWLVLSVLALLALAGIGWVVYQALGPGEDDVVMVAVPHVIGDTEADAEAKIRERNLTVGEPVLQADDQPAGTVIGQDPAANTQVREESEVVLTVSSGPESIVIPDVEGMDEDSARTVLEGRELTVAEEVIEEDNPEYDEGIVTRTEPGEGTPVSPDDPVTLVVASGKTEVPDVEGKDIVDATVELRSARLVTIRDEEERSDVEPGTVLSQSVEAGQVVDYDTEVTLVVAIRPPEVIIETVTPEPTSE